MPTFLSDPPQMVYLILGGLLVITGVLSAQRQDRRATLAFAIAFLLMMAVFLIDRFLESPREEAVRRTFLLSVAADAQNPHTFSQDNFAEHLADTVTIYTSTSDSKTLTREELKHHRIWDLLRVGSVHVAVWNFAREDVKQPDDNTIEIGFLGKGEAAGKQVPVYLRATYTKQPDGSFKLSALRVFDPVDHTQAVALPNFP